MSASTPIAAPVGLTIREAWLQLADWFDRVLPCDCGCWRMTCLPRVTGLCSAIAVLVHRQEITEEQAKAMLSKLPKPQPAWSWPTNAEGAKARSAFCREQAKRLKP